MMLAIGTKAPDFTLPDQNGEMHSLKDYRGKKVILYFYPKDNTAGCTKQACGFAELYPQFREKGAVVLGVSKDSVASHKKFEEKYGLPFTLLSDTEKEVIQAYDVWKEKKNYGKVSMGVVRTTYLINEEGIIELPDNDYYGEINYQMRYRDIIGEPFSWLFIDAETLRQVAEKHGYAVEIIAEGKHDDYLARIFKNNQ